MYFSQTCDWPLSPATCGWQTCSGRCSLSPWLRLRLCPLAKYPCFSQGDLLYTAVSPLGFPLTSPAPCHLDSGSAVSRNLPPFLIPLRHTHPSVLSPFTICLLLGLTVQSQTSNSALRVWCSTRFSLLSLFLGHFLLFPNSVPLRLPLCFCGFFLREFCPIFMASHGYYVLISMKIFWFWFAPHSFGLSHLSLSL